MRQAIRATPTGPLAAGCSRALRQSWAAEGRWSRMDSSVTIALIQVGLMIVQIILTTRR
jgi:hypothetical protein